MSKRAAIGDVVEVQTPKGKAYAQLTHIDKKFGTLIRILPGIYEDPIDLAALVSRPARFSTFVPLQAMVNRGIVRVVARLPVPESAKAFPIFKTAMNFDRETQRFYDWWLWDGNKECRVGKLTEEQKDYPDRSIWNDTMLVDRIVSGWSPRDEAMLPLPREPVEDSGGTEQESSHAIRHYLYFRKRSAAESGAELVHRQGYRTTLSGRADDANWLLLVSPTIADSADDLDAQRSVLEEIAEQLDGEYDGWEAAAR